MRNWLRSLERILQLKSSIAVGGIFVVPLGIMVVVFIILDRFFAQFFGSFLEYTPLNSHLSFAGFSTFLLLLSLYISGLLGTRLWFMRTFGRVIVRVPFLGASYKRALYFHYTKQGFLRPVWVYRNGSLRVNAEGEVVDLILGNRRRGFFLREVIDNNLLLPPAFRIMCEVVLPPSQIVGGEPELFPFPLVAVQVTPGVAGFSKAIVTQGLEGYEEMRTVNWNIARERLPFKEFPAKDRRVLERLGIILPTATPLLSDTTDNT